MVLVVVPGKDAAAEDPGVVLGAEAIGELRAVLQCLELRFRKGLSLLVWGRECDLVTLRSARRNRTGLETIGASRSAWMVSWSWEMPSCRQGSSMRCMARSTFTGGSHPARDVTAEDVEDDVEGAGDLLLGSTQLRDVPGPDLAGLRSDGDAQLPGCLVDSLPGVSSGSPSSAERFFAPR